MSPRILSSAVIEDMEALAYGYGIPPTPVLVELRFLWWRFRAKSVSLPTERRVILLEGGAV